jgi:G3E family GTPase
MIIVLNKIDMINEAEREEKIEKMKKKIRKVFSTTKFPDPPIVLTSAMIGGEKVAAVGPIAATGKSKKDHSNKDHGNPFVKYSCLSFLILFMSMKLFLTVSSPLVSLYPFRPSPLCFILILLLSPPTRTYSPTYISGHP